MQVFKEIITMMPIPLKQYTPILEVLQVYEPTHSGALLIYRLAHPESA